MPVVLVDYAPIVERIRAGVPAFKLVDFAASFDAVQERGLTAIPASFVLPDTEGAGKNTLAAGVQQKVVQTFFVYTFVKFAGDALGGKALDLVKPLREPLINALLAWQPPGADGVITFAGGRREALANGILVWRDAFAFDTFYRRIP